MLIDYILPRKSLSIMGNNSQKSAESAKNRRYSRSSGFTHWMDNMKDKKVMKITLKSNGDGRGNFTMVYTDDSSDDFQSSKSVFTFTGSYRHLGSEEHNDLFGVSIVVNPKGAVVIEDDKKLDKSRLAAQKASAAKADGFVSSARENIPDAVMVDRQIKASNSIVKVTRFLTEKVTCKLTEGDCTQVWTIIPSTEPDCTETTPSEIERSVSWPWTIEPGAKFTHKAPPGTLDFVGEETFEASGMSSIDLKLRIPQLACGHTPPTVCLHEMGGWKLGKKSYGS